MIDMTYTHRYPFLRPLVWHRQVLPGSRYTHVVRHGQVRYYVYAPDYWLYDVAYAFVLGGCHDDTPPGMYTVRGITECPETDETQFGFYAHAAPVWPAPAHPPQKGGT